MRALVLSGGGPLAVAWECGLVAGLAEAGVIVGEADFILGTSAGAIVGAQLAHGRSPQALAEAILEEGKGIAPPGLQQFPPAVMAKLPELFVKAHSSPGDPALARAEIGAYAIVQPAEPEAASIARFAALLGRADWPERGFGCVVVDAEDGSIRILTRDSGASLPQAVAASCSLPGLSLPIEIGGRRYFDGGFASTANADLAIGYDEVLVISFRAAGLIGNRMEARLRPQLAGLRDGGARVQAILPDSACLALLDTMDVRRRPAIARAAIAQGRGLAGSVGFAAG